MFTQLQPAEPLGGLLSLIVKFQRITVFFPCSGTCIAHDHTRVALLTGEDNTMLGHLAQLQTPVVSSRRNVQAAACHQAPMASMRTHQMRCSTSTASSSRQQGKHAQSAVFQSPHSRYRHHVVLAAVGNGTNGNGKPAADEGEADALYGLLLDPLLMHG